MIPTIKFTRIHTGLTSVIVFVSTSDVIPPDSVPVETMSYTPITSPLPAIKKAQIIDGNK